MNNFRVMYTAAALAGLTLSAAAVAADAPPQTAPMIESASPSTVTPPPARRADVETLDGIVAALYDVISGPIGQARDWLRFRSLFVPEARIAAIGPRKDGSLAVRFMTPGEYIGANGVRLVESGFREIELGRRTERFGELAQVWTSYETVFEKDGTKMRGINSVQLMNDGKRWWIISLVFEAERAGLALPEDLQKKSGG